jgi:hypothetical protein
MEKNVGTFDRRLRIGLSLGLAAAAVLANLSPGLTLTLWLAAALMLTTGGAGFCPLYRLRNLSPNFKRGEHS